MKTITLKQAKRIKELCEEKKIEMWDSERYWCTTFNAKYYKKLEDNEDYQYTDEDVLKFIVDKEDYRYSCGLARGSAYTTGELLDITTKYKKKSEYRWDYLIEFSTELKKWTVSIDSVAEEIELNKNLTEALGDLLIYLLENNLIK